MCWDSSRGWWIRSAIRWSVRVELTRKAHAYFVGFAFRHGVDIEHYIISSGIREMVEGTSIYDEFEYVFASGFMYNHDNIAIWPALSVKYTNKTQYLFRINKGIKNCWDDAAINKYIPDEERPVPFENIIYIGDGETDGPAMKMTKHKGGTAIAVYDHKKPAKKKIADELLTLDRADYSFEADYTEGSKLDIIVNEKIKCQKK